jgi:MFS family permease
MRAFPFGGQRLVPTLAMAGLILLVHGYHYGVEDEAIYLPAVKQILNPTLYPHDSRFFAAQTGLTAFPAVMAFLSRVSHLSVHATFFVVYCFSVVAFVWVLELLAGKIFREARSRWAAVLVPCALWTMPVAGTALFIMDQHLHPRNLATIALLVAVLAVLEGRFAMAPAALAVAAAIHPLMALYGASLVVMFAKRGWALHLAGLAVGIPLGWYWLPPVAPASRQAANSYYFLSQWEWYEWVGIVGPLVILMACGRWARERAPMVGRVAQALVRFGVFYFVVALLFSFVPRFAQLAALQPMRSLQPIYLFMGFFAGGILVLWFGRHPAVLMVLFLGLCGGMFYAQREEFPATPHVEWPGLKPSNEWLLAYDWIRQNTPVAAYFAMNPRYMERPGADFHGFRALAERSALADQIEDKAVASLAPALAEEWWTETEALRDWSGFDAHAMGRLKARFGVDWVLLERDNPPRLGGLECPYENRRLRVCRMPEPTGRTIPRRDAVTLR